MEVVLLAVVQGITEWLPISSSGHLALLQTLLRIEEPVFFNVMLHIGTLMVVLAFFRRDIAKIIRVIFVRRDFRTEEGRLIGLIAVGTIPIAAIGITLGDVIKELFSSPIAVAVALMVTGIILYLTRRAKAGRSEMNYLDSIMVGLAQSAALVPGISRSGVTIATALLLGVKHEKGMKFSFLLSIPAVLGAAVEELMVVNVQHVDAVLLLVGMAITIVVGYVSLRVLSNVLRKGWFYFFAYYCWAAGLMVLSVLGLGFLSL